MMKVLKSMPYAQAKVDVTNGEVTLISYETYVATIDKNHVLWISGLYSATTRKHIKAFIAEYVPFPIGYKDIKWLATNPYGLDLDTGEPVYANSVNMGLALA